MARFLTDRGQGEDLTIALSRGQVFPADFLNMIAVGEEGGKLVDVLRHQANHYQDLAGRRAKALLVAGGRCIWLGYLIFMVLMILNLAGMYLRPLGG